jgi:hypothetical protein
VSPQKTPLDAFRAKRLRDETMKCMLALAGLAAFAGAAFAQHGSHGPASPYAGEETRAIKSLSEDDIAELRRGGGWGLAKAAELNGVPGPAHLLELKDAVPLTAEQVAGISEIFATMKADAIAEGERLIAREQALEAAFRARRVTPDSLRRMLAGIEESRAALRYIHLAAHLSASALLTEQQIARYVALRGYRDPCASVPPGHDPAMWRRHNACE